MTLATNMTWGELLAQARFLLNDKQSTRYRYSDETLLAACHFACLTMKQVRPDILVGRYLASGAASACFPPPPYEAADIDTIKVQLAPFPEIYHQPAVLFIAGYSELINEEFSGADRAAALLSGFKTQLMKATL